MEGSREREREGGKAGRWRGRKNNEREGGIDQRRKLAV